MSISMRTRGDCASCHDAESGPHSQCDEMGLGAVDRSMRRRRGRKDFLPIAFALAVPRNKQHCAHDDPPAMSRQKGLNALSEICRPST
jgi:hypothetical protein